MKRLPIDREISPSSKRYRSSPLRRDVHSRDHSPDREPREVRSYKRDESNKTRDQDDRPRKRFKDERVGQNRYNKPSSPDKSEFYSVCVSGFPSQVSDAEVKDALYYQFKKFGDFSVKITYNTQDKRLCYVNFRFSDDAYAAKDRCGKLIMFDRPVRVDAVLPNSKAQQRPHYNPRGSSPADRHDVDLFSNNSRSPPPTRRRNDSIGSDNRGDQRRGEPRFPYHLDHINPEDDDKATRTLFVGNLDSDVGINELHRIFGKFGFVEDIDVKMAPSGRGNPFAFVRYHNLDMAHRAKVELSGQYIGKYQCKIGYGKLTPTPCLWIGGLGPWIRVDTLEREFDRFGVIHKIFWPDDKSYAYVLYDNIEAASAACQEMRGFPLGGASKRLRVDFADPGQVTGDQPPAPAQPLSVGPSGDADDFGEAARVARGEIPSNPKRHSLSSDRPRNKDFRNQNILELNSRRGNRDFHDGRGDNRLLPRSRTSPDVRDREIRYDNGNQSPSRRQRTNQSSVFSDKRTGDRNSCEPTLMRVESLNDLGKCLPVVWNGAFALKNSWFSAQLHFISGDRSIVETFMQDISGEIPTLRITQRLRLDQTKLDEVAKRVVTVGPRGHCIMLAMPGATLTSDDSKVQQRLLKNLVTYLKQKDAAGVVSLLSVKDHDNTGVLHAFPPCEFGNEFLSQRAPNVAFDTSREDYLVVIAVKGGI